MYAKGMNAGKCYVRFTNGVTKNILSCKSAIEHWAVDNGIPVQKALDDYEALKEAKKEAQAKAREEAGILKGQARENAINVFQDTFGALDGATVHAFDGWVTQWEYLPSCAQTHVVYTDDKGRQWRILKDLEAHFG